MAAVTNAYLTYDATAIREDLSDIIYNIDPFDTPLMTMSGRRNVSNVTYDWQEDALPSVDTSNAEVEGFELARAASVATVRRSNVCQISYKDATVSATQNKVNNAGKRKEMAYQMALQGKALKRDMESILFGTVQVLDAGALATARNTRPIENWIDTNSSRGATGVDPVIATNTAVVDGTQRAITEILLKDVIKQCYDNGAEPNAVICGSWVKQVISGFAGRTSARQMISAKKIVAAVTMYASDFGDFKILPSRWIRARTALLVDPAYLTVAYLPKFVRTPIGTIGDATTEMIISEYGLQVGHSGAHGVVADLSTA